MTTIMMAPTTDPVDQVQRFAQEVVPLLHDRSSP